ncbi:MAG TPA: SulP family inorganic anion transporter [Candidatus Desulfobacillus sp.]|nr:SulP family inorganic anion transporter [Candidatus Desulfobacillus sp.]
MNRSFLSSQWLLRVFPFLRWRAMVNRASLRDDALAGLIGAIIVLPQGVAFATLAGMPPEYGLYAAMVPAIVGALWGSSWHLVSGPTNAISLVVFASISPLAEPGSAEYVGLVLTLTFMVGVMQLVMGVARLGTLVNFISHTVVIGFTAGAALLIIASQVKNFFGIDVPHGTMFFRIILTFFASLADIKPWVLAVGLVTLVSGMATRKWLPKIPYMIVAMLAGSLAATALNAWLGAEATGIKTLGALPSALPPLSAPRFSLDSMRTLVGLALALTALALTEAVSIARSIAVKSGQRIDGNQEFIGQGLSNLVGAFFSAYPSSGSFNRSGLNYEAGARTPLAAVFSAILLVIVLVFVAPLAAYLPIASMAAILFLVAWGLFDFHSISTILRTSRAESAVLLVTLMATLVMHLEFAIFFGITLSLMLYLNRTSQPGVRALVPNPDDPQRKFHPSPGEEAECPQAKIVRVEGSIYFGAVNSIGESFADIAERFPKQKHLLVMAKSINFVDIAGAEFLAQEARRRRKEGGRLYFYSLRRAAEEMLGKKPFIDDIGEDAIFHTKRRAIREIFDRLDRDICATCARRIFEECQSLPPPRPPAG